MELKTNPIGKYITPINEKNKENNYSNVLGVAIEKEFMPSVANLIDTDLSKYSVLRKGRFAFNPMHVGRDMKLPVAMYKNDEPALVSPAYSMFKVTSDEILPEYLELILKSSDFDHLCWFHTDASVRGGLTWDDFSNLEISVPSLQEQEKIVHDYKVVVDRIELLKEINDNLETVASNIYKNYFVNGIEENENYEIHLLKEFVPVITGKKDANVATTNGKYQFFSCSQDILWTNEYSFDCNAILVAGNGDFSVKFYTGKFEAYQRTYVLIPKSYQMRDLLYYVIKYYLPFATTAARGSVISFITKGILEEIKFYLPKNHDELHKYCSLFEKFNNVISNNNKEILILNKQKEILLSNLTKEV